MRSDIAARLMAEQLDRKVSGTDEGTRKGLGIPNKGIRAGHLLDNIHPPVLVGISGIRAVKAGERAGIAAQAQ